MTLYSSGNGGSFGGLRPPDEAATGIPHTNPVDPEAEEASRRRMRQLVAICMSVLADDDPETDQDAEESTENADQAAPEALPYAPRGPPESFCPL